MPADMPSNRERVQPGDTVTLRLDSLAAGGDAVGRHQGLAVFVEHGAPGDLAQVRVTQVARSYARATIAELIEAGPDRVDPPCPYFGDCGGCQWQHLDYAAQVRAKETILRESFTRIGGLQPGSIGPAAPMPDPWRYRAAAEYTVAPTQPPALGFLRTRSSDVVPIADCLVQHPLNVEVLRATNEWIAQRGASELWLVKTRTSFVEGRALVTLVFRGDDAAAGALAQHLVERVPQVAGISALVARDRRAQHRRLSQHLAGAEFIAEEVAGRRYRVSPDSFFQANPHQAGRLVDIVEQMAQVRPAETVVDAYCGVGLFLAPLAANAGQAVGIESNPAAVRDARGNLRAWGLRNARVIHERVERALPLMARPGGFPGARASGASTRRARHGLKAEVVVLDPPRQGCDREVVNAVAALGPRAVVLVSCDPATLARDAALLAEHGYVVRSSAHVDMFPHTWQVESVTLCER